MTTVSGYHIDVTLGDPKPLAHQWQSEETVTTSLVGGALKWRRQARRSWITGDDRAGVQLTLASQGARIRAWNPDAPVTVLALNVALSEAMRTAGYVPMHAAVAERSGEATAFLGPSGIGKSTTLWRARALGWAPVADDFAWLHLRTLKIAPARSDPYATPAPRPALLTRVLLLTRGRELDVSRLETTSPRDAVRGMWEAAGVPLCPINRARFAARLPFVLERLKVRRLVLGHDAPPMDA